MNSANCVATVGNDAAHIAAFFKNNGGHQRFDQRLSRVAAGPVLRNAVITDDTEFIQLVTSRRGFLPNSQSLRGSSGETAAHIAAAIGNTEALKLLLEAGLDPNAEDHCGETPLHYAALTGHNACAKMLLQYGANASAESNYAETALCVARQNIAVFLGVDASSVVDLLAAWENAEVASFK